MSNPCRAGTYRDEVLGETQLNCLRCPAGYYCPMGATLPLRCGGDALKGVGGTYCPEGASTYLTVPGGYYSNNDTNYQLVTCPYNHRCPRGAATYERCEGRVLCPIQEDGSGSEIGELCPAGSKVVDNSRYLSADSCEPCPAGMYSTLDDKDCYPCEGGYLCFGNTNRKKPTSRDYHNGEQCPKGHYCEAVELPIVTDPSLPTPCPKGTYRAEIGGALISDCLLCDADSYNPLVG